MDCFDPFAAGSDDRLDELAVRVPVPAVRQLRQEKGPVRPFVVHTAEIERTQRIVSRTDDEEAGEPPVELLEDVAQARRLEGSELLAGPSPEIAAAPAAAPAASAAPVQTEPVAKEEPA